MLFAVAVVGALSSDAPTLGQARAQERENGITQSALFVAGQEGYHSFRIPALIVSAKGTVLAFCEGRRHSRSDTGDIDLVLKRSLDGGKTWQPMQVVADDGPNTMGNPCPVVDRRTGTIWLPMTRNAGRDTQKQIESGTSSESRTVWISHSSDEGATWSRAIEITASTKAPDWSWYATGPGCGIQLTSGRLLIPCDHRVLGSPRLRSHVIYSDDQGASWKIGGVLGDKTNECQVIQRADGTLLINMRSYHGENCRAIATSADEGLTWSDVTLDRALVDPVCQASLLRYTLAAQDGKDRVLFSNPASTKRERMTVRLSYDEGRSWPVARVLHAGPAAYSSLTVLPDRQIGCLYERGEQSAYDNITLARLSLEWLSEGKDSLGPAKSR
jgi:sialidase-1